MFTREQAKQHLISLGIENPTDEQVSNYLNSVNGEIQKEKVKADANKEELERLRDIEKEYEETKNASLTAEEKYQKELAKLQEQAKLSTLSLNKLKAENILVSAGLKQEDIKDLLDGIVKEDEGLTTSLATNLANLVKTQKEITEKAVKADLLKNTPTPDGGSGNGDAKGEDIVLAENLISTKTNASKNSQSALNYYMGGNQ